MANSFGDAGTSSPAPCPIAPGIDQADSSPGNHVCTALAAASAERPRSEADAAAVSPPHAPMGNTGIQTSMYPPMGMVGVDSLLATIEGEKKETFCEWSSRIAEAVESRRGGDRLAYVQMMGATLFPRAVGFRCGVTWMDHVLDCDGVVYALRAKWPTRLVSTGDGLVNQDVSLVGGGRFAAKVEIGSTKLIRSGVQCAWREAVKVLEELGIAVVNSCVSRIDVRADLLNVPVVEFARALSERRFVSRFKKGYTLIPSDLSETETCYVGRRGYLTLRIYDKLAQLRQLPEVERDVKWELLMLEVLNGVPVESLTRVEWEMCREFLSQFENCRSVEGVLGALPLLLDRANTETFRLTVEENRGDNNQSRLTMSPLWERVRQEFAGYAGQSSGKLDRPMERPVRISEVMKQMLHRATTVAAVQAVAISTADDLLRILIPLLRMELNEHHVLAVQRKRQAMAKSGLAHTLGLDEFIQPEDVPF